MEDKHSTVQAEACQPVCWISALFLYHTVSYVSSSDVYSTLPCQCASSSTNLDALNQLGYKMFSSSPCTRLYHHCHESPYLQSCRMLTRLCVCPCSPGRRAPTAEGWPHSHTPPPAGHEDRTGPPPAGLLSKAAGRRARAGTTRQQVSLCCVLLLRENTFECRFSHTVQMGLSYRVACWWLTAWSLQTE